jgi:2-methylcitrate dehydratase PrpD
MLQCVDNRTWLICRKLSSDRHHSRRKLVLFAAMKRRDFLRSSASLGAAMTTLGFSATTLGASENPPCAPIPFPQTPGLTKYVAGFVRNTKFTDLPADVIDLGKKSILDGLGLTLAGSRAQNGKLFREYVASIGLPDRGATVMGTKNKLTPRFAAFANGLAIHVEDFDDTQLAVGKDRVYGLLTHPTAPVLPAALALTEMMAASAKDFLVAYHLGMEVESKIAEAISPRHYEDGFHSTGTCGVFGSTTACARLRNFDGSQISRAFGIAASQAAGLRENFGTMMKSFHAGHAAEVGIFSTDLAALGWTGAEQILEADRGFFHAFGGSYDPAFIFHKLGQPWTFADPGVSIKPYPCGSLTHPGMTEMQRLIRTEKIKAADVDFVEVGTNHNLPNALIHHHPKNNLQAKFSMEFCIAILLIEGKAGLGEFTDAVVNRPDVQQMIERVRFYTDPEAEKAGYDKMTTILKIHLKDGRVIAGRADFGKGSPANPMSYGEVAEKFHGCADFAQWPIASANKIVELVRHLEDLDDIRTLTTLCGG